MRRSEKRILTTHTGSLPRPLALTRLYAKRARGEPVDTAELAAAGRAAMRDIVTKQVDAGVDLLRDDVPHGGAAGRCKLSRIDRLAPRALRIEPGQRQRAREAAGVCGENSFLAAPHVPPPGCLLRSIRPGRFESRRIAAAHPCPLAPASSRLKAVRALLRGRSSIAMLCPGDVFDNRARFAAHVDILWPDRHLAVAARNIQYVGRLREPGEAAA